MSSVNTQTLRPTLWRTCRVLANRSRLRILRELSVHPEQRVSDIAQRLGLSLSTTSQSLRLLNARGLLAARRAGRAVWYSPCANRSVPESARLLRVIMGALAGDKKSEDNIFRCATAFTHPRRILIMRTLSMLPLQRKEIAVRTGMSQRALSRHLRKLIARGFVKHADGCYTRAFPRDKLARLLLDMATRA